MTNREWMLLISKEFNVSHTVAKGMLSAMYKAKRILSVSRDIRDQQEEKEKREQRELKTYEAMDAEDLEVLYAKH